MKEQFAQFDETDETIKGVIGDAENNEDDEELILDKLHEDILNMDENANLLEIQTLVDRTVAWLEKYVGGPEKSKV